MCGICGIWGESNEQAVNAMVGAMYHRGPDDSGTYLDQKVSLGMTRLAIIDVSAGGHQPMATESGLIHIVYNGETYNFKSERAILESKGCAFRSSSDTEVVLRMYEEYGDDFLKRLRGMFALAIYDKRRGPGKERLLLARDHFGIKPLLYTRVGNKLVFGSEIKTILASGMVAPEVDPAGLRYLLTFGSVYQPNTILRNVKMIPPAHRMIIENGEERIERYWSLAVDRNPGLRNASYAEAVEEVASAIEESVNLQMVSDVPLGAFLSGGIDSSLIVAMMARSAGKRIKTFSVGFGDEGAHIDETDEAETIARYIGTDHRGVLVTGAEVRDDIEHIARCLDQPSVDGVNTYYVSKAARRAVTVAISGNGGDELFAGYPWFIFMMKDRERQMADPVRAFARSVVSSIARQTLFDPLMSGSAGDIIGRVRNLSGFTARYANTWQIFGSAGAARLLQKDVRAGSGAGRSLHRDLFGLDEIPGGSVIERVTGLCLRGYNNNQLLRDSDAVAMGHSLEVRVPFLDPEVVDTALSLPDSAKLGSTAKLENEYLQSYRDSGAKRILLDVGKKYLPPDFDKRLKRGFGMPFNAWLQGPLKEVVLDTLSETQVKRRGLLDPKAVSSVREAFLRNEIEWTRPWVLMMLELWCREIIDKPAGP